MHHRSPIALVLAAAALAMAPHAARALDDLSKYPNLKGQWQLLGTHRWESKTHQAPLTPEYRAVYEDNLARMEAGGVGDMASWYCLPQGMPMMMSLYDPMEIIVTPETTYILVNWVEHTRRIYTDGRSWPAEIEPTLTGYSIGRWLDESNRGRYDTLEVETRGPFKGPRHYDAAGLPLHHDNLSIFKERFYLDKSEKNLLHDQITVVDHALTRPWTVTRDFRRNPNPRPNWGEFVCAEGNAYVTIENETYFLSADGQLMPMKKGQRPPDLHYFK